MKYEIEIRSLKGYRSGVQCIWEKEVLVREQLFHHAYGVRQLPDKGSLYKQDFLELVQKRIAPASFCRTHLTFFVEDRLDFPPQHSQSLSDSFFQKVLFFLRPFNGLITRGQKTRPWSEVDIEVDKKLYTTFYKQGDLCSWQQTFETIVLPGHRGFLGDMKISQKIRTKDSHFDAPYILILSTEWTKGTSGRPEIDLFWDRESSQK